MIGVHLTECFKIQILQSETGCASLEKMKPAFQINCSQFSVFKEPTIIIADPFLFVRNDTLFLFYESKKLYQDAVLKMVSTKDLIQWTDPVTVLQEPFHLSYPWVFEYNGHIYMMPESSKDRSIRLYEANNEGLTQFHLIKKILEMPGDEDVTFSFSDSSVYEKDGVWYLHTTISRDNHNILKLYTSNSLFGPYVEHPSSPVSHDQKYARNAGCLFKYNGKLLRPAQDCSKRYGDNVQLLEITSLTPVQYSESVLRKSLLNTEIPFYKEGGHQLNLVSFLGQTIVATDAKEYHSFWLTRALHKMGLLKV